MNPQSQRLAFIALIAGGCALGLSPLFVRISEVGPTATAFWRVALAVPITLLLVRGAGERLLPTSPREFLLLAAAGLAFAGDLITWHISIHYTSIANSTLFANTAPVWVALVGWLVLGQRFSRVFLAGMALAFAGAAVLVGVSVDLGPRALIGDGLALITGVCYAGYFLAVKALRRTLGAAAVMLWSSATTAVFVLPAALATEPVLLPTSLSGWAIVIGLAAISHTGGQGLIAWALAMLPAAFSSVTLLIQPLIAAVLAWVLLGEALSAVQIAGGALLLTGIWVARRGS